MSDTPSKSTVGAPGCGSLANELARELSAAQSRIAELESLITSHNGMCESMCDYHRQDGRCEPYLSRNKTCSDCPRGWLVEIEEAREAK